MTTAVLEDISKSMDKIEAALATQSAKAAEEIKNIGKLSHDTKTAIDNIGIEQIKMADRLLQLEQKGTVAPIVPDGGISYGEQFTKSAIYTGARGDMKNAIRQGLGIDLEKAAILTSAAAIQPQQIGFSEGPFRRLSIESYLTTLPVSGPSVIWTKENVFVNAAGEVVEGTQKPEMGITFTTDTTSIATVAHLVHVSEQLVEDAPMLTAYINRRCEYGVNLRVENQIIAGDGVGPNINGLMVAGNFTPHGYTAASLTALGLSPTNGIDVMRMAMVDIEVGDYIADVVVMNTRDWGIMSLQKDAQGHYLFGSPADTAIPRIGGRPVLTSNAIPAGKFWTGSLQQAVTFFVRSAMRVELFRENKDNVEKNLVTIRAERRCGLAVDRPASTRFGDIRPA